jgi:hypothetical protein
MTPSRRAFLTTLAGGIFVPKVEKWFRMGFGLWQPEEPAWLAADYKSLRIWTPEEAANYAGMSSDYVSVTVWGDSRTRFPSWHEVSHLIATGELPQYPTQAQRAG